MNIQPYAMDNHSLNQLYYSENTSMNVTGKDNDGNIITININKETQIYSEKVHLQQKPFDELKEKLSEYTTKLLFEAHLKASQPQEGIRQYTYIEYQSKTNISIEVDENFNFDDYSPEKVSQRIVDMALAFSGDDLDKLEEMKEAIDKGFEAAEGILGELPEVSKKTYDLIQQKLQKLEA